MDREEQSSLGDPSSPPPTPSSPTAFQDINNFGKTTITSREKEVSYDRLHLEDTLGLDIDAVTYELDAQANFEDENGKNIQGKELVTYLINSNNALTKKVKTYFVKCSDLQQQIYTEQDTCYKKLESIRKFYRNLIFYGNSRGAVMVKMATNKHL